MTKNSNPEYINNSQITTYKSSIENKKPEWLINV